MSEPNESSDAATGSLSGLRVLALMARVPWPFDDEARKKEVLEFVRHTFKTDGPRCRLVPGELEKLRVAQEDGAWLWFGKIVYDAAKNHEMLPEPATGKPLTDFADLWPRAKEHYEKTPGKKRSVAVAAGKWPEFALAVHSDLVPAKFGPVSVSSYGPCRPADFKDPLRLFVADLEKKVRPAEWAELKAHEGRWPDYPRALVKLATQHDLSVPGVTPPGAPSLWEKNYNPKPAPPKGAE